MKESQKSAAIGLIQIMAISLEAALEALKAGETLLAVEALAKLSDMASETAGTMVDIFAKEQGKTVQQVCGCPNCLAEMTETNEDKASPTSN